MKASSQTLWLGLAAITLVLAINASAQSTSQLYGLDFSPYLNGQDPNLSPQISVAQITTRMQIVAPYTKWIRSFSSTNGLENTPLVARQFGLKVAANAWISGNLAQNSTEIANLIAAAKAGQVDVAIVGSEALLRNDVSESQLLSYMSQVRQAIPQSVQVTTADTYGTLLAHPNVIAASDVIFGNFYPYWEGVSINNAVCSLAQDYQQLVAAAGGKQVIISETGWPSGGNAVGAAVPSPANAAQFFIQLVSWATTNNVPYFYFEAFDENWKAAYEGPQGAYWGIWDATGVLKAGMQPVFSGQTAPVSCSGVPGGPGTPSISYTYVPSYGSTDYLEGQELHADTGANKAVTYISVPGSGGWWVKPYSELPLTNIQVDGSFSTRIVTGGSDQLATAIATFLIPNSYSPPILLGVGTLPAELYQNSLANVQVNRTANSISGTITDGQAHPIAGVTVTLSGANAATTQSAPDGKYSFPNLPNSGAATITPVSSFYSFTPPTQSYSNISGNQAANFTAQPVTYSISGKITLSGSGLKSVTVTLIGTQNGSTTTDATGSYSFSGLVSGNYTLIPSLTGYDFNPPSSTFSRLSSNQVANFSATMLAPASPILISPNNGATGVTLTPVLGWGTASGATSYDVYFGTSSTPPLATNTTGTTYSPGALNAGTTYDWVVIAKNAAGSTSSATWSFTTIQAPALSITKTHTGSFTQGQTNATYIVTVSNGSGAGTTSGAVTMTETPPSGLTLLSMSGSGWNCGATSCTRSDALVGGTSYPAITVTARVAANAASPQVNQAGVSGGGSNSASASDSTVVIPVVSTTITTNPLGLNMSVDGSMLIAPQTFQWTAGSQHSISVTSPQSTTGTRYTFLNWSDTGAQSHNITTPSTGTTYTANFSTQYLLTTTASGCGATIIASPSASDGYYSSGTAVQLTAVPSSGCQFTGWSGSGSGSYTGSNNPASVTMNGPITETAVLTPTPTGLYFYPVTPCRLADTRGNGFAGAFGPPSMSGGSTRVFPIPTGGCHIPSTAQAYSLNVTAVPPGQLAYLTIWPTGQTQPTVSTLNDFSTQVATPGNVIANAAIVPAGTNGSVSVYVSDTSDVIMDVNGYFALPGTGGLAFYPLTPCRIADTRGNGKTGSFGPPSMGGGSNRSFPIPQSSCNLPSTAQAYSLNMTVVPPGQLTYLTTWPSGQAMPVVSTLNDFSNGIPAQAMGKVVENLAIVPAGANGAVSVFVSDSTDVIIDINGYFAPPGGAGALSFYPETLLCRVADTRSGSGFNSLFGPPGLSASFFRRFPILQSSCNVPSTAQAYSLNVTVAPPAQLTYLTIWPCGVAQPLASTLNDFSILNGVPGRVVASAAIVQGGADGSVCVFASDPTDLILDINGYFAP